MARLHVTTAQENRTESMVGESRVNHRYSWFTQDQVFANMFESLAPVEKSRTGCFTEGLKSVG